LADYVDEVGVFHGRLGPAHFPEHAHPEVTVAVNLEGTSCLATWETATGRRLTRLVREGHTSVIPGGQPHAGEWLREAGLLHLYLSPSFVSRAAGDLIDGDRAEVAEDHTAEDPLIWQLGSALRAELLRQGGPPGRLYVDSLANVLAVHLLRRYSVACKHPPEP
jgi:AraC family transcriptional regulator